MDPEYVLVYADLYRKHWWWRAREEFVFELLSNHLAGRGPQRILDVGCGGGLFFDRLGELGEVEGVEIDVSMRTGIEAIDSRIHWGTVGTLPEGRRYDVVLLLDVLEHSADPESLLGFVLGVLAPGGLTVITVPAFPILWTNHDEVNQHLRRYTKRSLQALTSRLGLRALSLNYFFHWTFPAKLLMRMFEGRWKNTAGPSKLPTVPVSPVNRALFLLSRLEQRTGLWHWCPFGSSLLFLGTNESSCRPVIDVSRVRILPEETSDS